MNNMRLTSFRKMFVGFSGIVQKYPVITGIAFLKMVFAIWQFKVDSVSLGKDVELLNLLLRITMILHLALPLFYSLHLIIERYRITITQKISAAAGIIAFLVIYFLTINTQPIPVDWYRFGIFFLVMHSLVAIIPYTQKGDISVFWQHNKNMVLQFLNATFYSAILYIGLLIAIYAIEVLFQFQFDFPSEAYTFCILALFLHTLFFLLGMEREQEKGMSYPKTLKFFAQYALLPLVFIYLCILYAYTIKIIINWELPQGGVAYLILSMAVAGILVYLLVYPWQNDSEEKWINQFSRYFFPAVLPLNILLFAGIARRISDYYITENRYLVLTLAIWLAGISLYMIFSRQKDIRLIPCTMAVIGLFISVGPWNMFSVSLKSQQNRFEEILKRNNLLDDDGKIAGKAVVLHEDYIQVFDIAQYFYSRKELDSIIPYLSQVSDTTDDISLFQRIRENLSSHISSDTTLFIRHLSYITAYSDEPAEFFSLEGMDYLWKIRIKDSTVILNNGYSVVIDSDSASLIIHYENKEFVKWDLKEKMQAIDTKYGNSSFGIAASDMELESKNPLCRLIITNMSYNPDQKDMPKFTLEGYLLLKDNFKSTYAKDSSQLLE